MDVWLNTPRRPHEASGTSGMKGPVNGGINFSIADGWWCEVQNPDAGWTIGNGQESDNPDTQDYTGQRIASTTVLEEKIVPLFYKRDAEGLPAKWIKMMKASIATVTPRFSTARMVRDYVEQAYLPAAKRSGAVTVATPEQSW